MRSVSPVPQTDSAGYGQLLLDRAEVSAHPRRTSSADQSDLRVHRKTRWLFSSAVLPILPAQSGDC